MLQKCESVGKIKKREARQEVLQCHSSYFAKRYKLETCVSRMPSSRDPVKTGTCLHTHIYTSNM